MNNVCLCTGNYAKNPFYLKFSDISLYSIEELCYYFMERVHLLDDSIVSAELSTGFAMNAGLHNWQMNLMAMSGNMCLWRHLSRLFSIGRGCMMPIRSNRLTAF